MEFTALVERMMASIDAIHFICILSKDGSLLHWLDRNGYSMKRLPRGFFKQVAIEAEMYRILSDEYGDARFTYIERARAKQLIIFGKSSMMVVGLEHRIETSKALQIVDEVVKVIKMVAAVGT
ncbi:hypothetical protein HRbin04_01201 [archaeon HR04]|nr:hypothetical protein HRbin04_01201 [archaeon HR04]